MSSAKDQRSRSQKALDVDCNDGSRPLLEAPWAGPAHTGPQCNKQSPLGTHPLVQNRPSSGGVRGHSGTNSVYDRYQSSSRVPFVMSLPETNRPELYEVTFTPRTLLSTTDPWFELDAWASRNTHHPDFGTCI